MAERRAKDGSKIGKRGRPKLGGSAQKGPSAQVAARLPPVLAAAFERKCQREGLSTAEGLRAAVAAWARGGES